MERWLLWHSAGMLAVILLASWAPDPSLLAVYSGVSLAGLLFLGRRAWSPTGHFGSANVVTTLRLGGVLGLLLTAGALPLPGTGILGLLILVLDGLDGWLARRDGLEGPFGALYDVEVDSVLVTALPLALHHAGLIPRALVWVGAWHYLYVLAPLVVPTPVGRAPRTRFGRTIYALMIGSFLLAFVLPSAFAPWLCSFGTLLVSLSFVRSFWQRYRISDAS